MSFSLPPAVYRIENVKAGTYITCSGEEPGIVYGWASRPDHALQKWEVKQVGQSYHLCNLGNGEFMTASDTTPTTNVRVSGVPALFSISEVKASIGWYITIQGSNAAVNLQYGSDANGTPIALQPIDKNLTQRRWRFKRVAGEETLPAYYVPNGQSEANRLIPFATYSIHNTSLGNPLNPSMNSSADWDLQPGRFGYLFKHKVSGAFLGCEQLDVASQQGRITADSDPTEWVISRAHEGYHIRLAAHPTLYVGLGMADNKDGPSESIRLSTKNSASRQVWTFVMANA